MFFDVAFGDWGGHIDGDRRLDTMFGGDLSAFVFDSHGSVMGNRNSHGSNMVTDGIGKVVSKEMLGISLSFTFDQTDMSRMTAMFGNDIFTDFFGHGVARFGYKVLCRVSAVRCGISKGSMVTQPLGFRGGLSQSGQKAENSYFGDHGQLPTIVFRTEVCPMYSA